MSAGSRPPGRPDPAQALVHRVRPPAGTPAGALVLWHGRGADENDLWPLLDILDPERRLIGVTPRGPLSLPPYGAHWYVVERVGFPDPATFWPSYRQTSGWLDAWLARAGVAPEKTLLGGFSQRGVVAYARALGRGRPRPAGLLAFSSFIPTVEGFELDLEGLAGWPVAIGHGTYDDIISVDFGRAARRALEVAGAAVTYRESPMAHGIDPEFLGSLRPFLEEALR